MGRRHTRTETPGIARVLPRHTRARGGPRPAREPTLDGRAGDRSPFAVPPTPPRGMSPPGEQPAAISESRAEPQPPVEGPAVRGAACPPRCSLTRPKDDRT